jgi:hypothetical protein
MQTFSDGSTTWVAASSADPTAAATLSFTTPHAADFYIWCRVFAPSDSSDSLEVTVDQEAALDDDVHGEAAPPPEVYQSGWTWSRIQSSPGAARAFALGGGPHTIRFGFREDTLLDRVVIVANPDFIPTDGLPQGGDFVAIVTHPQDGSVTVGASVTLSAAIVATGPVRIQWLHNGVPVPTEGGTSLTLSNVRQDQGGSYSLAARLGTVTAASRSAILSVLPVETTPVIRIRSMKIGAEGQISFEYEGALGAEIEVHGSSDLVNWSLIATRANTGDTLTVIDPEAISAPARFYRLADIGRP